MVTYVQQSIFLGSAPNDGTGDTKRIGGDIINDNFDEIFGAISFETGGTLGVSFDILGNVTFNKKLNIEDTTESTSPTTGSLQTDGGAGIVGNTSVGGFIVPTSGGVVTVDSGEITATSSFHFLAGEGGVADDLVTINGGLPGALLHLRGSSTGVVTVKDGSPLRIAGDFVMPDSNAMMTLINIATGIWLEISRSSN